MNGGDPITTYKSWDDPSRIQAKFTNNFTFTWEFPFKSIPTKSMFRCDLFVLGRVDIVVGFIMIIIIMNFYEILLLYPIHSYTKNSWYFFGLHH